MEATTSASSGDDAVPEEIEDTCLQCHEALVALDRLLKPVVATSHVQTEEKVSLVSCVSCCLCCDSAG